MATIPEPKEQSVLPDGQLAYQNIPGATPDAFGASLGHAIQQLGDTVANIALRQQGIRNETAGVQGDNDYMTGVQDLQYGNKEKGIVGYHTLQGQNAIDALPDYQQKIDELRKNVRESMNPAVARMFDQTAFRIQRAATDSMGAYSDAQQRVATTNTFRAKVNLYLHVVGKREDGYHLLDSLAVFPSIGDVVSAEAAATLTLRLTGRFGRALVAEPDNLVLRAATALQQVAGVSDGAALSLEKNLPIASGIGGGSADAAATLRVLCRLWRITPDPAALHAIAIWLGADVPVCLDQRTTSRSTCPSVHGIGASARQRD